jgi:hypothetical protein
MHAKTVPYCMAQDRLQLDHTPAACPSLAVAIRRSLVLARDNGFGEPSFSENEKSTTQLKNVHVT